MTNVVCNRSHPFNFGMIAPGNHLDLGQHRIMGQGDSARDFDTSESMKNAGILDVFPNFNTARLGQKIRRSPQYPLCGAALDSLRAAPPARYRSVVRQIGIWRTVR
ncbi:MAG: hypothetical protein PUJ12_08260, partial [Oscillospiraceae bacterium]|nr:hypothetical protein [Oscillospiraceae bacterium]